MKVIPFILQMHQRLKTIADDLGISESLLLAKNLCVYQEATELEVVSTDNQGRSYQLTPVAAAAWRKLSACAVLDDVELTLVSAFRSIDRQADIIRRKLAADISIDDILTVLAPPGYSEHHTGCAVDISTPGTAPATLAFEQTSAFAWLNAHAQHFGFYLSFPQDNTYGYQYEPWHWCFHPSSPTAD